MIKYFETTVIKNMQLMLFICYGPHVCKYFFKQIFFSAFWPPVHTQMEF